MQAYLTVAVFASRFMGLGIKCDYLLWNQSSTNFKYDSTFGRLLTTT